MYKQKEKEKSYLPIKYAYIFEMFYPWPFPEF